MMTPGEDQFLQLLWGEGRRAAFFTYPQNKHNLAQYYRDRL